MLFVNACFCILVIGLGFVIWYNPLRGVKYLCWVAAMEIVYFFGQVLLSTPALFGESIAQQFGVAFGVGGVGMYLQLFSGFPVWALMVALLIARRLKFTGGLLAEGKKG